MPQKRLIYTILVAGLIINLNALAFDKTQIECIDKVYEKNLKTVRFHPAEWESGYPVLNLYTNDALLLSFDQLESSPEYYYYTVLHCTWDWKISDLMYFEYAEGFEENEIIDLEDSHSTMVQYTHFKLPIPNRDIKLTKSGNYLLIVYKKTDNGDELVITRRFMIYENMTELTGRINAAVQSDYRTRYQKPDFRINRKGLKIFDHFNEIKIAVMQNYQWNTLKSGFDPSFVDNDFLVYEFDEKLNFNAANEYRYFNFNNLELNSENVQNIEFKKPYYYIDLVTDKAAMFAPYRSVEDINGSYVVRTNRFGQRNYPQVQSEYAIVEFSLSYNIPLNNADIYLYGELTNYELSDEYKLKYNLENRTYEKLLFLKQGYYNYRYILVNHAENSMIDHSFFEGSHQETENDYLIFIYYRPVGSSYDKLINFSVLNSRNI